MEITNILVIVTRYFGGILLGTGGLVKAYSNSTKLALEKAEISMLEEGFVYKLELNYSDLENFKYFMKNNEIKILKEEYFENVKLSIFVPKNKIDCLNSNNINEFNITNMKKDERTHTKNP